MQQNTVICPNCGTNAIRITSKLIALNRFVFWGSILLTIASVISVIGLIVVIPMLPFMLGAIIITYILRKTIKEDLLCQCRNCKNVWRLKGRKKTWF